jgi:hypothetical protein
MDELETKYINVLRNEFTREELTELLEKDTHDEYIEAAMMDASVEDLEEMMSL